jgi:hypothetical protein
MASRRDLSGRRRRPTKFPGDFTPEQERGRAAQRAFEQARPEDPGKEPRKPDHVLSRRGQPFGQREASAPA